MIKKIAETAGDNAAGVNVGWLIQQFWNNLNLEDKLRSAILINSYILRCTNLNEKTFSCETRYMNGSILVWQTVIASEGQYIEVSSYDNNPINVHDYSATHVGNAVLYVL